MHIIPGVRRPPSIRVSLLLPPRAPYGMYTQDQGPHQDRLLPTQGLGAVIALIRPCLWGRVNAGYGVWVG